MYRSHSACSSSGSGIPAAQTVDYGKAAVFDEIWNSTDDAAYARKVSEDFFRSNTSYTEIRSPELATDEATTDEVIVDFTERHDFDILCTIQVTNPMVRPEDFKGALDYMLQYNYASMVSVVKVHRFAWPYWMRDKRTGAWPINYDVFIGVAVLVGILYFYICTIAVIRRLHDFGRSGSDFVELYNPFKYVSLICSLWFESGETEANKQARREYQIQQYESKHGSHRSRKDNY